jgi:octanoyl-[GcvH]:protein N-octanoyltransferase
LPPSAEGCGRWEIRDETAGLGDTHGDDLLLGELAVPPHRPVARLWQAAPSLVVPRRLSDLTLFDHAAARSARRNWPVVTRGSGGHAVPLQPGILNLTLAYPAASGWSIDAAYRHLAGILVAALCATGIDARIGEVPGAFCPGRFDLSVGGRKVAGTAQRRRPLPDGSSLVLAHACLLVEGDLAPALAALAAFERELALPALWQPERAATLARPADETGLLPGIAAAIRSVLHRTLPPGYMPADHCF